MAKVRLVREGGVYTPAMQVHLESCRPPVHCCEWLWQHCPHLESTDVNVAARNAHDLARRIGVPCDAPAPKGK